MFSMKIERGKLVVGLTGGIASGKSTALKFFSDLGWATLSVDSIANNILQTDQIIISQLVEHFGDSIIKSCGNIDKEALGGIIFEKNAERNWLEALLHPLIRSKWISFVHSCPDNKCIIELPLLFENNLQHHFNIVLSVYSPPSTTISRLSQRGLSSEQSSARMNAQLPIKQKSDLADYILWGGGSPKFLNCQINQFLESFSNLS